MELECYKWLNKDYPCYGYSCSPEYLRKYEFGDKIVLPSKIFDKLDKHRLIGSSSNIFKLSYTPDYDKKRIIYCSIAEYNIYKKIYIPNVFNKI